MDSLIVTFKNYIIRVLTIAEFPKDQLTSYTEDLTNKIIVGVVLDLGKDVPQDTLLALEDAVKKKESNRIEELINETSLKEIYKENLSQQLKKSFLDFAQRIMEAAYEPNRPLIQQIIDEFQASFGKTGQASN